MATLITSCSSRAPIIDLKASLLIIIVPNLSMFSASSSASAGAKSDESTTGVSAQFSCDFCNKTFSSREELKQHSTQEHSRNE